jgi:hypothetical protein
MRLVPPKIKPLPAASEPRSADPAQSRPKNETARISTLPPPPAVPPVPLEVTASQVDGFDAIPSPFRWVLFGIASANFLIQIWIYVVS